MDMIKQAAKMFGGMATPWLVKGLTWLASTIGVDAAAADINTTAAVLLSFVIGGIVYAVPNKAKPAA